MSGPIQFFTIMLVSIAFILLFLIPVAALLQRVNIDERPPFSWIGKWIDYWVNWSMK